MSDNIIDNLADDVALASALRNFLTTPAVIDLVRAVVTEAVNAEISRTNVLTVSRLTALFDTYGGQSSFTPDERNLLAELKSFIDSRIDHELDDRLPYYIHEDDFESKFNDMIDLDGKIEAKIADTMDDSITEAIRDLRIVRRD